MRRPKPGQSVYAKGRDKAVEVESVSGDYVWCTWIEDGEKRRGVFNRRDLEKAP